MNGFRPHRGNRRARLPALLLLCRWADPVPTGERYLARFTPPNCLTGCLNRRGAAVQNLAHSSPRRV